MQIDSLRIEKFCDETGWTVNAIRSRINSGEWLEGREYTKVGQILLISIEGYESWVQKNRQTVPACLSKI